MLEIKNNRIYLTRGDSAYIRLDLTDTNGATYEPAAGDKIIFRLKRRLFTEKIILEKEIDPKTLTLELMPNETKNLDFDTYHYEVELVSVSGQCFTVIENADFVIGVELET